MRHGKARDMMTARRLLSESEGSWLCHRAQECGRGGVWLRGPSGCGNVSGASSFAYVRWRCDEEDWIRAGLVRGLPRNVRVHAQPAHAMGARRQAIAHELCISMQGRDASSLSKAVAIVSGPFAACGVVRGRLVPKVGSRWTWEIA